MRSVLMCSSALPPVSSSGPMIPLQGGHGDGRLQTASPQAQVMTPAPRPPTPTQQPPQQQAAQQPSQPPHPQQPSLPPAHSHGQNGYSSNKHSQSQAAFHSEFTHTLQSCCLELGQIMSYQKTSTHFNFLVRMYPLRIYY